MQTNERFVASPAELIKLSGSRAEKSSLQLSVALPASPPEAMMISCQSGLFRAVCQLYCKMKQKGIHEFKLWWIGLYFIRAVTWWGGWNQSIRIHLILAYRRYEDTNTAPIDGKNTPCFTVDSCVELSRVYDRFTIAFFSLNQMSHHFLSLSLFSALLIKQMYAAGKRGFVFAMIWHGENRFCRQITAQSVVSSSHK